MGTLLKYWDGSAWQPFTGDIPAPTTSIITKETPTGLVNGVNTLFTTATKYVGGSLQCYINGIAQSGLLTETTPASGIFAISPAPLTGDNLSVAYQYAPTGTGNSDTVDSYHANATPTANTIPVLDGSATLPQSIVQSPTLGFTQITSGVSTTSSSYTQAAGLSITVIVPAGGRRVRISSATWAMGPSATAYVGMSIWDGAVGSGTQITEVESYIATQFHYYVAGTTVASAGSHTYNIGFKTSAGTATINAKSSAPTYILVELI